MALDDKGLEQSNFSRLRERLDKTDLACRFFDAVVKEACSRGLMPDEHFTADGTLIEAWASTTKSLKRKDGPPSQGGLDDQGMVNFRGEGRSNGTHESQTDPQAKLMRKGKGRESKLSFGGHALMENRNGLCVDIQVRSVLDTETQAAKDMLARQGRKHVRPTTLGLTRAITQRISLHTCEARTSLRISLGSTRATRQGLMGATTRHAGYAISQRKRKRVEEIFGWMKTYGGLRRTMARGLARVRIHAFIVAAAYNLLRMSRLRLAAG